MEERLDSSNNAIIFSKVNIKKFIGATLFFFAIWGLYSLLTGFLVGRPPLPGDLGYFDPETNPAIPLEGEPLGGLHPGQGAIGLQAIWPLWGSLIQPNLFQILFACLIFAGFYFAITYISKKIRRNPSIILIGGIGAGIIILTNLIQGWETGIADSIGAMSEAYWDISKVTSILDFISNYASIQPTLSIHAETQPPGLIIFLYILNLILNDPALCALALCIIATVLSCFFLFKIFQHFVDLSSAKYTVFLFILLPAVQIYYLANIYAINATLVFGTIYFYLFDKKKIGIIGSILCLFLLVFTTFLSVWLPLFLGIFELLRLSHNKYLQKETFKQLGLFGWIKKVIQQIDKFILLCGVVLGIYLLLYLTIGFNYLEAFFYASSVENPNGFMLFADPLQYFATRAQNILDIVFCFGPILIVLFQFGIVELKKTSKNNEDSYKMYIFVIAALLALLLMFLTGAPKKGETARICLFILPFLLLPIISWMNKNNISKNEKIKLAMLVFVQSITMQLFFNFIW